MRDFTILSPGKKILNIRKDFKIKQEDITGGDITRNLISIIENDKANLTPQVAKILAFNINEICKARNLDFSVTEEYLLESVVDQAKKVADDYIKYIKGIASGSTAILEDVLPEIDIFLKTYETEEKKAEIYTLIATRYEEAKLYQNAYMYNLRAYESSLDNKVTSDILLKLAFCAKNLLKYDEAIKFYDTANSLNSNIKTYHQYEFYYNRAFCYSKQKKYDQALKLLEEFNPNLNEFTNESTQKYLEYLLLKGECLKETKSFNKAVNIYKSMLKNISKEDLNNRLIVYLNLCALYENLDDYSNLRKNSSKALDIINSTEFKFNDDEAYIYYVIGHTLKKLEDLSKAEEYLFKSLDLMKAYNGKEFQDLSYNIFMDAIDIFKSHKDTEKMDYLKNEFFEMMSLGIFDKYSPLILKFIQYYNNIADYEGVNNLLSYCLNS